MSTTTATTNKKQTSNNNNNNNTNNNINKNRRDEFIKMKGDATVKQTKYDVGGNWNIMCHASCPNIGSPETARISTGTTVTKLPTKVIKQTTSTSTQKQKHPPTKTKTVSTSSTSASASTPVVPKRSSMPAVSVASTKTSTKTTTTPVSSPIKKKQPIATSATTSSSPNKSVPQPKMKTKPSLQDQPRRASTSDIGSKYKEIVKVHINAPDGTIYTIDNIQAIGSTIANIQEWLFQEMQDVLPNKYTTKPSMLILQNEQTGEILTNHPQRTLMEANIRSTNNSSGTETTLELQHMIVFVQKQEINKNNNNETNVDEILDVFVHPDMTIQEFKDHLYLKHGIDVNDDTIVLEYNGIKLSQQQYHKKTLTELNIGDQDDIIMKIMA